MTNINDIALPPKIKDGTITALIYRLGTSDPKMSAKDMHTAVLRKFPGTGISTIYALRTSFGFRERGTHTPPNAVSATSKPKGAKRAPYKKKRAAAPTEAPASSNGVAPKVSALDAFRVLVARIGTDAAHEHLKRIEKDL